MTKIVGAKEAIRHIESIILNAEDLIVLVSPFVEPPDGIFNAMELASRNGKRIFLVCRVNKLKIQVRDRLQGIPTLRIIDQASMHAKCYFNEKELVISSLNLLKYSVEKSKELGTYFEASQSQKQFSEALADAVSRLAIPELNKEILQKARILNQYRDLSRKEYSDRHRLFDFRLIKGEKGYCIRCRNRMDYFNGNYPMCYTCFADWAQEYDYLHIENWCHRCGKETKNVARPISKARPLCYACFADYISMLKLKPSYNVPQAPGVNSFANENLPSEEVSVSKQTERRDSINRRKKKIVLYLLVISFSLLAWLIFYNTSYVTEQGGADIFRKRVVDYYESQNQGKFNSEVFFQQPVRGFFGKKNLSCKEIQSLVDRSAQERMYPSTILIGDSSLSITPLSSGNVRVKVWAKYNCFRKSMSKYQYSIVQHEFEFNSQGKIVELNELDVRQLHYSFKREH